MKTTLNSSDKWERGGTISTDHTPKRVEEPVSVLESALLIQKHMIDDLDETIGLLMERLSPITDRRPVACGEGEAGQQEESESSPVVEMLRNSNRRLDRISQTISRVLPKLDI